MIQFRSSSPFRPARPPRPPLRIARLIVLLLVVLWLMGMARQPRSWSWLWQVTKQAGATSDGATAERPKEFDTRVRRAPEPPGEAGVFVAVLPDESPAPSTASRSVPGLQLERLQSVKDDAAIRAAEHAPLAHLIEVLHSSDAQTLAAGAQTDVAFAQLYQQPHVFRGQLVRLAGQVRRADWIRAPRNEVGIEKLAELWLQPADAPANPVAIYCLELPAAFPMGVTLSEPVTLTGFFFKRWLYNAQDTLRTTPLIVCKSIDWRRDTPIAVPAVTGREILRIVIIGAVCGLAAAVYLFRAAGRRRPARGISAVLLASAFLGLVGRAMAAPPPQVPAREMFELFGIELADWDQLRDAPQIEPTAAPMLKLLHAVRRVPAVYWARWSQGDAVGPPVIRHLTGRLVDARYVPIGGDDQTKYGLTGCWDVQCTLDDGRAARIVAVDAPVAWRDEPARGDRISAFGVGSHEQPGATVWTTARVAWRPDTPLGNLGVDVGQLSLVDDRTRLQRTDTEPFYEILAAVEKLADAELTLPQGPVTPVAPLFNKPAEQRGKRVVLEGNVRRAVRIDVTDAALVERFGIDHYYEIELFTDDSQGSPLVACVRRLPAEFPLGDAVYQRIRVGGFFFKVWAYELTLPRESVATEPPDKKRFQLAPLILGKSVVWLPRPAATGAPTAGWISAALFAAAVVLGAVWYWRQRVDDRQVASRQPTMAADAAFLHELAQRHEPPAPGPP